MDRLAAPPRTLDGRIDLDRIRAALGSGTILLESTPGTPHAIPWSVIALPSGHTVEDDGSLTVLRGPDGRRVLGSDPFAAVDLVCAELGLTPDELPPADAPPFTGGLVGAFSYDLARRVERLPASARADRDLPQMHLAFAPAAVAVDHRVEEAWIVRRELGPVVPPTATQIEARIAAEAVDVPSDPVPTLPRVTARRSVGRTGYLQAVAAILDHIAAGDAFQVNYTQRLTVPWSLGAVALYQRLRAVSPAPHGALIPALGIASISPESFLLASGREVLTRPMKGTRPRDADRGRDSTAAAELADSHKDRAENVMVVDLQRNDLGRVCVEGSVSVPTLCELEAHPTVWQLVSTVKGTLTPGVGWGELLRATLPCGSVTGAPKVAAMTLIERYEPVRRGFYCGAIGWLGAGSLRLSVAIRTAVVSDARADYGAGGGIVADSDPEGEYEESLVKAQAFLQAVSGTLPGSPA